MHINHGNQNVMLIYFIITRRCASADVYDA